MRLPFANLCSRSGRWPAHGLPIAALAIVVAAGCSPGTEEEAAQGPVPIEDALTFHCSFDGSPDAEFALGDPKIYSAPSYEEIDQAQAGLNVPGVQIASGAGRFGDALRFNEKNTQALFFKAQDNVPYSAVNMEGTLSFWLSLDPQSDLEPGYSDPIQVTDSAFDDSAIWVDFTKGAEEAEDEEEAEPRQFRLGVFGEKKTWNPDDEDPEENPDFENRLVAVDNPPFQSGKWTHVVITYEDLNLPRGGVARLYLDGQLQGETERVLEPFTWDVENAAIRIGVNYVGLFDDLAVFSRPLTQEEITNLHEIVEPREEEE